MCLPHKFLHQESERYQCVGWQGIAGRYSACVVVFILYITDRQGLSYLQRFKVLSEKTELNWNIVVLWDGAGKGHNGGIEQN